MCFGKILSRRKYSRGKPGPGRMWYSIKLRSMLKWKVMKANINTTLRSADARLCILDCIDLHNYNLIKDGLVHGNVCYVGRTGDSRWQYSPVARSVQSLWNSICLLFSFRKGQTAPNIYIDTYKTVNSQNFKPVTVQQYSEQCGTATRMGSAMGFHPDKPRVRWQCPVGNTFPPPNHMNSRT